jgi:hypothetical protein
MRSSQSNFLGRFTLLVSALSSHSMSSKFSSDWVASLKSAWYTCFSASVNSKTVFPPPTRSISSAQSWESMRSRINLLSYDSRSMVRFASSRPNRVAVRVRCRKRLGTKCPPFRPGVCIRNEWCVRQDGRVLTCGARALKTWSTFHYRAG